MPYVGGVAQQADPKFLMDRLMKNGYSRAQAAAIVGNLQRESGLASNNMNKDEGAYGLMQWRGPRFEALQQFAVSQGKPWTDPGTQADFIAREMQTTERKNATDFMAAKTVDEASAALKPVIRYGDKSGPERAMHARNFFGANDPVAGAVAPSVSSAPQPPAAQPAVSRETFYPQVAGSRSARPLRAGMESMGEGLSAQLEGRARMPPGLTRLGNALSGAGQQMGGLSGAQPPGNLPPEDLSRRIVTGLAQREPASNLSPAVPDADPAYLGGRDSMAGLLAGPPGAPEPPRFPGGVPMPRQRPMTGPGIPAGAPIDPLQTVAGLGSLVDPMDYSYG